MPIKIKYYLFGKKYTYLIITVTVVLFMLWNIKNYNDHIYINSLTRFIPKIINKSNRIRLKSNCQCRKDPIEIIDYNDYHKIIMKNSYENYTFQKSLINIGGSTCNLYNVLRRGPNQKIIAYSLYGKNSFYYKNIEKIAKQAKKLYPDWTIRIHHDDSINSSVICEIECLKNDENGEYLDNVDFCDMNRIPYGSQVETWNANYINKMIWRWLPIGDPFVDIFISRDSDSPLSQREVDAVNEWLNSKTLFHIMRDNPAHWSHFVGCCWGYANRLDRKLSDKLFVLMTDRNIAIYYAEDKRGPDQLFLKDFFWKYAVKNSLIHDSYLCKHLGGVGFPTKRKNSCFVGCIDDCCEESANNTLPECPYECRPESHKDWKYC